MNKKQDKKTEYKKILQNKAINILNCVNDKMLIENKLKGTKEISIDKIKEQLQGKEKHGFQPEQTRYQTIFLYYLLKTYHTGAK